MESCLFERLKHPAIFILPLAGTILLVLGWVSTMIHVFKVQPEKVWLYRKNSLIRYFVNSEIKHIATDENYIGRARGGGIAYLIIGTAFTIACIIKLIDYIISWYQN